MEQISYPGTMRRRRGVNKVKRHSLRTDMTPMVDLGFLLITFFVMTVQLSKPSVVDLNMPKDGPPMLLGNSNAITILIGSEDKIYYYKGNWKEAVSNKEIHKTSLSLAGGIGIILRQQQIVLEHLDKKEGREGLMMIIKPGKDATYKNIMNVLDEALINVVKKYAIIPADADELSWMDQQE